MHSILLLLLYFKQLKTTIIYNSRSLPNDEFAMYNGGKKSENKGEIIIKRSNGHGWPTCASNSTYNGTNK